MNKFEVNENIAPFVIQEIDENSYRARLKDVSNFVEKWSNGNQKYVDVRYISEWFKKIGIAHKNIFCYMDGFENNEWIVEWDNN